MTNRLPKYKNPPVVETVLSVQFDPVPQFTNAHSGWFWKNYLGSEWSNIRQTVPVPDQLERFGDSKKWAPGTLPGLRLVKDGESERVQITNALGDRMIQIQSNRFIYNWRKIESTYPSFDTTLLEFEKYFSEYEKFAKEAKFDNFELNQWEATYINHIFQDPLWNTLQDLPKLIPGFYIPDDKNSQVDNFSGSWSLIIGENVGRLHVTINHVKIKSSEGPEAIALQLVARGPITDKTSLRDGLMIGHESIVEAFTKMTSEIAHDYWEKY